MFGNVNKVILMGRLTRDPEVRAFASGKVASFGLAVNNRKKDANGDWVDDPCFVDVKCFDREKGLKLANLVGECVHKGHRLFVAGHLVMESWEDKNGGGKRSKLVVIADDIQLLESRKEQPDAGIAERKPEKKPAFADRGRDSFFHGDPF